MQELLCRSLQLAVAEVAVLSAVVVGLQENTPMHLLLLGRLSCSHRTSLPSSGKVLEVVFCLLLHSIV